MDLRQIRTFCAVAELGSLSSASDRLRIAQPALSRQIRLLEHELKVALFIRHGRGMSLTEAGQLLFERLAGTVRQLERARDEVASLAGQLSGRVVVGMVPTVGSALSGAVAQRVVAAYPGITLRIVEAYGSYLVEWLHRGELDLAVIYGPSSAVHLNADTLRTDELLVVAAAGSGVGGLGSVTLDWLSTQPLVLPSYPHALRALVEAQFARLGFAPRVVLEADSFGALMAIVTAGVGMTLLPFYAVGDRVGRDVETCRVVSGLRRELILASPSRLDPSPAVQAVVGIIKSEAARLPGGPDDRASQAG